MVSKNAGNKFAGTAIVAERKRMKQSWEIIFIPAPVEPFYRPSSAGRVPPDEGHFPQSPRCLAPIRLFFQLNKMGFYSNIYPYGEPWGKDLSC